MSKKEKEIAKEVGQCYTMLTTVHYGNETLIKGECYELNSEDLVYLKDHVMLTSEFKKMDCGCK